MKRIIQKLILIIWSIPCLLWSLFLEVGWIAFCMCILPFYAIYLWAKDELRDDTVGLWRFFLLPFIRYYLNYYWGCKINMEP